MFTLGSAGSASGKFGRSIDAGKDVNGDGIPDIVVGAPLPSGTPGQAMILSGSDGSVLHTLNGNLNGDLFGQSVSNAGDVDDLLGRALERLGVGDNNGASDFLNEALVTGGDDNQMALAHYILGSAQFETNSEGAIEELYGWI